MFRKRSALLASRGWRRSASRGPVPFRLETLEGRQLLAGDVVISEIMHHPVDPADPTQMALGREYIEIFNKGTTAANLLNWRFTKGIDFTFTAANLARLGTQVLNPGQYLVIAADLDVFRAAYPGVGNVIGGWTGRLSNSHEQIELRDAANAVVDEVHYADDGDWAVRERGLGTNLVQSVTCDLRISSITRSGTIATATTVAPHGLSSGATVSVRGAFDAPFNGAFTVNVVDATRFTYTVPSTAPATTSGIMFTDIRTATATVILPSHGYANGDTVRIAGAAESAFNGTFTVGVSTATGVIRDNWFTYPLGSVPAAHTATGMVTSRLLVNRRHSGWTYQQAADGLGSSLELINPAVDNSSGQNWASSVAFGGTPGSPNSVARTDIAPMILDAAHGPVIPKPTEAVTVTAKLVDEQPTYLGASLHWRVDGAGAAFQSLAMRDDGTGGDAVAGDHVWTAVIPPQVDGAIVEYYISATDGTNWRTWPAPALDAGGVPQQSTNALYQVEAADYLGPQPIYRVIMTEAERAELATIGAASNGDEDGNAQMNATFIAIDGTGMNVRYGVGVRNRGHGSRTGPPNNYHVSFPGDRTFRGLTAVNFNCRYVHSQVAGSAIYRLVGLPAADASAVQLRVNGANLAQSGGYMFGSYVMIESQDSDFVENHFPDDSAGNLYAAFRLDPTGVPEAELQYEGLNPDLYRERYIKQTNAEEDDYSDLVNLARVLNNTSDANYLQAVSQVVDVQQWLRYIAIDELMLNWETGLVTGIGDDYFLYRGAKDARFKLVPHDLDTLMNVNSSQSGPLSTSIFSIVDGVSGRGDGVEGLKGFLNHPQITPLYYATVLEVIQEVFNPQVINPLLDDLLGDFVPAATINSMKQFVVNRTTQVLAQIPRTFSVSSGLAAGVGGYAYTASPLAPVQGTADVSTTRSVTVNGQLVQYDPRTGVWQSTSQTGTSSRMYLPRGSDWKYFDQGQNLGTAWREKVYPAADGWPHGPAELGYGDGANGVDPGGTVVGYVDTDPNTAGVQKNITTYFRTSFTVPAGEAATISSLLLRFRRDDGIAIYLNGKELWRDNLPGTVGDNTLTYTTRAINAIGGADESTFYSRTVALSPGDLTDGENVLAVEIHQSSPTSSDISFDLEVEGIMPSAAGGIALVPGINRLYAQAHDGPGGTGKVVASGFVDVMYDAQGTGVTTGLPAPDVAVSALQVIAPAGYLPGVPFLVQVAALDAQGQVQRDLWDAIATLSADSPSVQVSASEVILHNGYGSLLVTVTGTGSFNLIASCGSHSVTRAVADLAGAPMTTVSGTLAGAATTWSGIVHITGQLTVPDQHVLTIQPGTYVLLDGIVSGTNGVGIDVLGSVQSLGTADQPVVFTAYNGVGNWGEIHHNTAEPSLYRYTQISRAGSSPAVGHSNSGPQFRVEGNSKITFDHAALTDNKGKVMHASGADLTFVGSEISRSVMGPEVSGTALLMEDTFIYEMRGTDDNDAIYIWGQQAGQLINIRRGMMGFTNDDGLDTMNSVLAIDGTIFRDTGDKGASIYNGEPSFTRCLFVNNGITPEDGLAASVSAKTDANRAAVVSLDHVTIVGSGAAVQAKDKYNVSGDTIIYNISNSILWSPDSLQIDPTYPISTVQFNVRYSLLNEDGSALGPGNVQAAPLFQGGGTYFHLAPGSPAVDSGDPAGPLDPDGSRSDMGAYADNLGGTHTMPHTVTDLTLPAGDTYLYPGAGPYHINGDVTVPVGAVLRIMPGVTVYWGQGGAIKVNGGQLLAEGTEHAPVRFTRTPGSTAVGEGIHFADTMLDNRITHAIVEYGGLSTTLSGMIGLSASRLTIEHAYLDNADRYRIRTTDSSLIVRDSYFADIFPGNAAPTSDNRSEHINGTGIAAGGVLLIENNIFGTTKGHNDAIDFDGAALPGPIPQIIGNTFRGGGDDALDLECDAYIEGNTFTRFIKDSYNLDPGNSNAISAGAGHHYTVVRNIFFDLQHVALVKDDSFLDFTNNTVVNVSDSAIYFDLAGQTSGPGRGAAIDGSIFQNLPAVLGDQIAWPGNVTVNRSVVPALLHSLGIGNTDGDPRLRSPATGDFSLRPGSVAEQAGPNGVDMGAVVPAWASISGEPWAQTSRTGATLAVGGAGITHYRYRVNDGPWSGEIPVTAPIELSGLSNGTYTVQVIGKNVAGVWQSQAEPTTSRTWSINASLPKVRINEVLAINDSAVYHNGYPDLIELFNEGTSAVSLNGWSISDELGNRKYNFASTASIAPGQYLIIYLDNKAVPGEIHTNKFALKSTGEGVFLYDPTSGTTPVDSVVFGPQASNLSIGRGADGRWYLNRPTFGLPNKRQITGDASLLRINEWLTEGVQPYPDDFVELYNPDTLPVDLGGLYLTDDPFAQPGKHAIAPLSFMTAGGFFAFIADDNVGGGPEHVTFKLAPGGEIIGLMDRDLRPIDIVLYKPQKVGQSQGRSPDGSAAFKYFATPNPNLSNPTSTTQSPLPLRIVELNYNPPGSAAYPSEQYEFIELMNIGAAEINLLNVAFVGGVQFTFPARTLAPNERVLIVKNQAAFLERYGPGFDIVGEYADSLSDNGEVIRVLDSGGMTVHDFAYSDIWQPATDGGGYALVVTDPHANPGLWAYSGNWTAGQSILGTPGFDEPVLSPDSVVINEILSHSHGSAPDWIELLNRSGQSIDIGGWYLSDSASDLRKFRLPSRTLQDGEFALYYEDTDFGSAAIPTGFGLSELGETLYLSAADENGTLTGYRYVVVFGAAETGVSFGRHVTSTGGVHFPPMDRPTPGTPNSPPKVGPVVVSEIMYNAAGSGPDYIELRNATGQAVPLYDPSNPQNTWRFDAGIEFVFPPGSSIEPWSHVLIVNAEPMAYASALGLPASKVFGPFQNGTGLSGSGEKVRLVKPGGPEPDGTVPWISADEVEYGVTTPWPTEPDGKGPSLSRKGIGIYGNDPANWEAGPVGGTPLADTRVLLGHEYDETFTVRLAADEVTIQVLSGQAVIASYLLSQGGGFTLKGFGGNDNLVIDASNGNPLPYGGICFEGGAGTNIVRLIGTTSGDALGVDQSGATLGTARVIAGEASIVLDAASGQVMELASLEINGNGRLSFAEGQKLLKFSTLSLSPTATLDLTDGNMILRDGAIAQVLSWIASARGGGTGMAAQRQPGRGLGAILNDRGDGRAIMGTFCGQPVVAGDVLVRFTLDGDSDLNGRLDGDDYFRIDKGYFLASQGQAVERTYRNGDVNGDLSIDIEDYILIDSAFLVQLTGSGGGSAGRVVASGMSREGEEAPSSGPAGADEAEVPVVATGRLGAADWQPASADEATKAEAVGVSPTTQGITSALFGDTPILA